MASSGHKVHKSYGIVHGLAAGSIPSLMVGYLVVLATCLFHLAPYGAFHKAYYLFFGYNYCALAENVGGVGVASCVGDVGKRKVDVVEAAEAHWSFRYD